MKKSVITALAIASLTTVTIGTSFGAADRMRGRGVELEELATVTPVSVRIDESPEQGLMPVVVTGIIFAEYYYLVDPLWVYYGCLTGTSPREIGDTVFDVR